MVTHYKHSHSGTVV